MTWRLSQHTSAFTPQRRASCARASINTADMEDEDPFGMGPPPSLSEPEPAAAGDDFGMMAEPTPAPPSDDFGMPTSDASFGEAAAPPMDMGGAMPPMDMGGMGGMDAMGGMSMGGGMDMGGMGGGGLDADAFSAPPGGDMGPVAKWRIEQQEKVAAKATAAAAAEAEKISEAQAALQQFYAERAEKTAARASSNRAAEAQYVQDRDAAMVADSWASVATMVDLKEKAGATTDVSRMRSLLIQLKN